MAQIILFNPSNGFLIDKIDVWPPWPLIYISTKSHREYSIKIIDERIDKKWKNILDKELNEETICVGVTSLTGLQLKYSLGFLEEIKKRMPKIKTIMGGVHVTSTPEESIREPLLDFVVVGDGESTFPELVKAIENKSDFSKLKQIKGLAYKDESENPVINPSREFEDLDKLGELPLHLIDMEKYISTERKMRKFIIFSSRGCPMNCAYCFNSNEYNRKRWNAISAEKLFKFVKMLNENYNIDYVVLQDDNFWISKKRVEKFVSLLEENDLKIKWAIYGATIVTLKYITPEIAQRFVNAGLEKVLCGIESVSPKIQKIIGKNIKIEDIYSVDKIMASAGIKMIYSFMCGFPEETDEDIKFNIKVMMQIMKQSPNNDVGNIKPTVYYPGTRLFNWALENGFKPPRTFIEWSNYSWSNYDILSYPWVDKNRKTFFQQLYFTTLLLNPDYEYIQSPYWKYTAKVLHPVTKWRVKNYYFKYSIVLSFLNIMKKMNLM